LKALARLTNSNQAPLPLNTALVAENLSRTRTRKEENKQEQQQEQEQEQEQEQGQKQEQRHTTIIATVRATCLMRSLIAAAAWRW
jgi:uncharacterized membrane protein YebE (DUF533 family)